MLWLIIPAGALAIITLMLSFGHWRDYEDGPDRSIKRYLISLLDSLSGIAGGVALVLLLDIAGFRGEDPPHGASAVFWVALNGICMLAAGAFIGVKLEFQHDLRRKCVGYACVLALVALCYARIVYRL